ncbi:MAG: sodium:alanine symporter family protein [Lachnospiraceae bacterium]|nr:sodium:alanine symporter family protein [Lachnospiraceae bacterium]
MKNFPQMIVFIDDFLWGPAMIALLLGTGLFLSIRTRFTIQKNLKYALGKAFCTGTSKKGEGDISPFASLATSLAATIGTGNIVGVATAMVSGGAGALVWMWISAALGLTTKFSECMLAVKYREINDMGEMCGGPMYTMKNAFAHKKAGRFAGLTFAAFTVAASFGIGNLTQSNSIAKAAGESFSIPEKLSGAIITLLAFVIITGGIKNISKAASLIIPVMAALYILGGLAVILLNISRVPAGLVMIFKSAFSIKAVGGGLGGSAAVSMFSALRYGAARGVFSNEAGMGSAAIIAAAATTDNHVSQGYISMTSNFWDTMIVCTITGLCIAVTGVLGVSETVTGASLTILAFESVMGRMGGRLVTLGIIIFAFSTILGWEYNGEKAFEFILGTCRYNIIYRIIFSLSVYAGAIASVTTVWCLSDIANALMIIPNLVCLLVLSGEVAADVKAYEAGRRREK